MGLPIKGCLNPFYFEEIRPSIEYIDKYNNENDAIYIYSGSIPAFEFYQNKYDIEDNLKIKGNVFGTNDEKYNLEIERIKELELSRVWVLFSHNRIEEREYLLTKFNSIGQLKLKYEFGGASAHLFQINHQIEK